MVGSGHNIRLNAIPELEIRELRRLKDGYILSSSLIGAFVYGVGKRSDEPLKTGYICSAVPHALEFEEAYYPPDDDIKNYFSLEGLGINPSLLDFNSDAFALEHFKNTVIHDGERFQVSLPWIEDKKWDLKDNFGLSLGRLISLYKQVQAKNPQSFENFKKIIAEQEERGIIEKLDAPFEETELLCPIHYIPWQVVFKVQANFTKERIVYNASAKCGKGARSLNECLFKGPDLNTHIVGHAI